MRWLALLIPLFQVSAFASEGGTHGGGGGNALVCFAETSPWPARIRGGDRTMNTPYVIPDAALSAVKSISLLDLEYEGAITSTPADGSVLRFETVWWASLFSRNPSRPQITNHDYRKDPRVFNVMMDSEFDHVAERYKTLLPGIYEQMMWAKSALRVEDLGFVEKPVEQIADYKLKTVIYANLRPNCVVTTMLNQWSDHGVAKWSADARLYFHPHHDYFSQFASVLHERVYWISRESLHDHPTSPEATYYFVSATMTEKMSAEKANTYFNGLFYNTLTYPLPDSARGAQLPTE